MLNKNPAETEYCMNAVQQGSDLGLANPKISYLRRNRDDNRGNGGGGRSNPR